MLYRRPSLDDHIQRPALCTARWRLGVTQRVARSVGVNQDLLLCWRLAFWAVLWSQLHYWLHVVLPVTKCWNWMCYVNRGRDQCLSTVDCRLDRRQSTWARRKDGYSYRWNQNTSVHRNVMMNDNLLDYLSDHGSAQSPSYLHFTFVHFRLSFARAWRGRRSSSVIVRYVWNIWSYCCTIFDRISNISDEQAITDGCCIVAVCSHALSSKRLCVCIALSVSEVWKNVVSDLFFICPIATAYSMGHCDNVIIA